MASLSAYKVARFFGEISPKIKIKSVRIPVAIPTPTLPKSFNASDVEMDEAVRFTILLPIKTALNILEELSVTASTLAARLLPSSASVRIRMRFTVVREVSAEEKKPDSSNKIIRQINCMISVVCNKKTPREICDRNYCKVA